MSTFFITFVTTALFIDVDKTLAKRLIAVITGLVVVIRIAEIFLDPLLGNLVDNTNTRWGGPPVAVHRRHGARASC